MNLYKIDRTDRTDWDEYDSIVVRASSEEEALSMLKSKTSQFEEFSGMKSDGSNVTIAQLTYAGKPGLVIGSFNAG